MWHFAYNCHKLLLRIIGFRDTACWHKAGRALATLPTYGINNERPVRALAMANEMLDLVGEAFGSAEHPET